MTLMLSLEELGKLTSAQIYGDSSLMISGVETLEDATSLQVSFLENPRYEQQMRASNAGAIFITPHVTPQEGKNYLIVTNPSMAFQKAVEFFLKPACSGFLTIHPTAVIHPTVKIGNNVTVGPYAVIDQETLIGDDVTIGAHTYVGPKCVIGNSCYFYPHATIHDRTQIGHRVTIQSGAVIGSSGFGYATDKMGKHHPLKQLGIVVIDDDVEIGANTTVDRARFKETRIRRGSKIDNLVQIAHQVDIGEDNLIVAQVGIAGSTKTGRNVVIAGQVGIVGHITIGDGVILTARSAASKSVLKAGVYGGAPAVPIKDFNEQIVLLRNIKKIIARVDALEKNIDQKYNIQ